MPKSDLPFGSQFSPAQVDLPRVLELVERHDGSRPKLTEALYQEFFPDRPRKTGLGKGGGGLDLADNTVLSLIAYGILEREPGDKDVTRLTDFGRTLCQVRHDEDKLYDTLARHILLNLKGIDLVETAADMLHGGHKVTVPEIARNLQERGLYVPEGGTHINSMKQWLDKAGVFEEGWRVDSKRYEELVGVSSVELEALAGLTNQQKAFARAVARLGVPEIPSNKVAEYARELYGVRFSAKGLPQEVLFPLRDVGLLTCEKTTAGRGAKPYVVRPTEKLRSELLEPIFSALESAVGIKYRKLVRMSYDKIRRGLFAKSRHEKGLALEALALYLSRLIDLTFIGWRLRSAETAGAEVDVIVEGTRLVFSRWQIQCKNVKQVSLDDVAKEVGIAFRLKSNVIMVVSTGRFSSSARDYAQDIMRDTNYNVILLDAADLQAIERLPTEVTAILLREAKRAMEIKRLDL